MENLEKLFSSLDDDRERAAERYEKIRSKLIRLFEWKGTLVPEDLADAVIDRVAHRLQSGLEYSAGDLSDAYFFGVAHHVYQEHLRREMQQHAIASAVGDSLAGAETQEPDFRLDALHSALKELPVEQRKLLLDYYQADDRVKKRLELARHYGIPLNGLRVRIHRLRRKVEQRVTEILESGVPKSPEPEAIYKPQLVLPTAMPAGEPDFLLIWDPEVLSAEEYSALVGALGDLVRASGGLGISRAQPEGYKVPASMVVPA